MSFLIVFSPRYLDSCLPYAHHLTYPIILLCPPSFHSLTHSPRAIISERREELLRMRDTHVASIRLDFYYSSSHQGKLGASRESLNLPEGNAAKRDGKATW